MTDKRKILEEIAKRKIRNNFWLFCIYMNKDFYKKRKFLKELADMLNESWYAFEKGIKRVKNNYAMPRRAGKTYTTGLFCAWSIGKDPTREIVYASHRKTKAEKEVMAIWQIINSDKWKAIFGEVPELIQDTQESKTFKNHYRASLSATSVVAGKTGEGCSILITDDAYKSETEALSERINDRTISNYFASLSSSLDGDRQIEMIIGTRWRKGELADVLDDTDYFDNSIKIRAIQDGKSFCDDIKTIEELEEEREKIGEHMFMAMYQQEPMFAIGGLFEKGDFEYIEDIDTHTISRIAVIDPKSTGKDVYVVGIFNIGYNRVILEDVIYTDEVLTEELINRTASLINYYDVDEIFIETNKEYTLSLNLQKMTTAKINAFSSVQNKEIKILTNAMYIKDIQLMQTDDIEYSEFLKELWKYDIKKSNKQDGATDVMAMATIIMRENKRRLGLGIWND